MKRIRPEYTPPKEELIDDNTKIIIDGHEITDFTEPTMHFEPNLQQGQLLEIKKVTPIENGLKVDCKPIEQLMNETIDENKIKVEFTLTKRQHELWQKKGAEKWLKKVLVGQANKKRGK